MSARNVFLDAVGKVDDVKVLRALIHQFLEQHDQLKAEIRKLRDEDEELSDSLTFTRGSPDDIVLENASLTMEVFQQHEGAYRMVMAQ